MKKFIKLLAVALAAAALAGCSLVSINTEKITVATVGEDTITKAAFDEEFNAFLAQYGYTQDSTEIADQLPDLKEQYINMMVQNLVIEQKIEELGLGEVTDEERAAAEQSVQDWYDEQFAQLVETYSADETVEDPEAEATTTIENYLSYYGTTLEQMKQEEVDYIPTQKLYDEVTKTSPSPRKRSRASSPPSSPRPRPSTTRTSPPLSPTTRAATPSTTRPRACSSSNTSSSA